MKDEQAEKGDADRVVSEGMERVWLLEKHQKGLVTSLRSSMTDQCRSTGQAGELVPIQRLEESNVR